MANSSISTATLHLDWKLAFVSPIFKAGDKFHVSNYRPVSVVSTFSKIMEIIIKDKMLQHITVICCQTLNMVFEVASLSPTTWLVALLIG